MSNRLKAATSPYLLQHAENPVDWWPWGEEALAEAKRRNVPILLSVGYAACHWCHVMAHESFEDEATATLMNANFVNIKVDREERPDIDSVYMAATQAMTGQGGWPMTCFLTPEGEPFHCGTYYPPSPRPGMPSFSQLLVAVAEAWGERPEELRSGAQQIIAHLTEKSGPLPESVVDGAALESAVASLGKEYDAESGGFGGAPKFPPTMALNFLLRHHERTGSDLASVEHTAEAMALGGLNDQLAGGFARYSVDARWEVPHFEKMLYDNGLLLRFYAQFHGVTGHEYARRTVEETAEFLLRDLGTAEGGFAASLDADTDGVEGLTYVWTPAQLAEVLGEEDGAWAAELFQVSERGNFEHGASTLRLREPHPEDETRYERVRGALLAARNGRPQPARDDKVIAAWNGLAIGALAKAGSRLDRPQWIEAATRAAAFLMDTHFVDGRLRRTSRDGVVGTTAGVLEDYSCLAEGLLELHQATGEPRWLADAVTLLDLAVAHFGVPESPGAYYDTADDAEVLVQRPSDPTDNASPSGASALANALLTASVLAGHDRVGHYREAAEQALARAGRLVAHAPRFAGHWLTVAEAAAAGPVQVAVVGPDAAARSELLAAAVASLPDGAVVVSGTSDAEGVPLLADRPLVDGAAAAYVCRGYVCERPVTTAEELRSQLG
ncbi:thioredoxin domain-containing protein [Amycolatopsis oliviviridis]|uniref:Spermatogenesis-associated protein 20-like TRX domain-containing protein n=1 Tax=Amycolatopsis oliviviridis TaxID=1471590 RepID=A0ABQ3LJS9_9PSEU|nr:thioredoxin domain-containing protein [Amycolatopsis oliviviridis]GHH16954.1 hypothetical protein GCM10017790_33170 [Amycolatopsis oliviviridis]